MSPITTHVLDQASGRPAAGVKVVLERQAGADWQLLGRGVTDDDGRSKTLFSGSRLEVGHYRLTFDVGEYFAARKVSSFYSAIPIQFHIEQLTQHYHVPLLLSPFGYSTYRGS